MEEIITDGARHLDDDFFPFMDVFPLNPATKYVLENCIRSPTFFLAFLFALKEGDFSVHEYALGRRLKSPRRTEFTAETSNLQLLVITPEVNFIRDFFILMTEPSSYALRCECHRKRIPKHDKGANEIPLKQKRTYEPEKIEEAENVEDGAEMEPATKKGCLASFRRLLRGRTDKNKGMKEKKSDKKWWKFWICC